VGNGRKSHFLSLSLWFIFFSARKMEGGGGDAKSPPGASPRGPPHAGAALGGAATTRQVGQQHALDAYNKRLDSAVAKLNEHYANLLKSAKVHTARFPNHSHHV
jgi:hypothetical protein